MRYGDLREDFDPIGSHKDVVLNAHTPKTPILSRDEERKEEKRGKGLLNDLMTRERRNRQGEIDFSQRQVTYTVWKTQQRHEKS